MRVAGAISFILIVGFCIISLVALLSHLRQK